MQKVYVIDVCVNKETLDQLETEQAHFVILDTIKQNILRFREQALQEKIEFLEAKGQLTVQTDEAFQAMNQDDRLIELSQWLQETGETVVILSQDLLVHLKAQYHGISALPA